MEEPQKGHIVMTPKRKTDHSTTLAIERQLVLQDIETNSKVHVAGGDHQGIVINKEVTQAGDDDAPAQLSLEFRVFLVSAQTGKHTQESRLLQFWFVPGISAAQQATVAQELFRELVSPQDFPRDYVGFIKKVMKLLQHRYFVVTKVEVTLTQLDGVQTPPSRPTLVDESALPLTEERLLQLIESAFPNPVTAAELAATHGWVLSEVEERLVQLQARGVARALEHGAYTRSQSDDTHVQVVKQMPTVTSAKQPSIAIITAQYCDKLAVDAMLDNTETFVRYTTVGESNVYTLGNIGSHRIVCTKLPTVGHTREAVTAAGNTTTRLLGTFQKVDFVFLVGVGGGVPHYTDYNKHVRLGDVVVSCPVGDHRYVYVYCESAKQTPGGSYEFETKEYCPSILDLQEIAMKLKNEAEQCGAEAPWLPHLRRGLHALPDQDFNQPPPESDKLYMALGGQDMIEVAHPAPLSGAVTRLEGCPRLHLAPVASGRAVSRDDTVRQHFAAHTGALAFDSEFDAVLESVRGNCRDSFVCVRGVADYKDGTRQREWQPYAALTAASVMRAIVCAMKPPDES